jgi:hypothetical protein
VEWRKDHTPIYETRAVFIPGTLRGFVVCILATLAQSRRLRRLAYRIATNRNVKGANPLADHYVDA